jgi:Leucine-rich repeat (LRR) protein
MKRVLELETERPIKRIRIETKVGNANWTILDVPIELFNHCSFTLREFIKLAMTCKTLYSTAKTTTQIRFNQVINYKSSMRQWIHLMSNIKIRDKKSFKSLKRAKEQFESILCPSNIHGIDLSFSNITDISPLGSKSDSLHVLYLNNTEIDDLSSLKEFPSLTTLTLSSTKVSDISFLGSGIFSSLSVLNLSFTSIIDISVLSTSLRLHTLNISGTSIDLHYPSLRYYILSISLKLM